MLKNEFSLNFISEFCSLSPKCYSIKLSDYSIRKMLDILYDAFIQISRDYVVNVICNDMNYAFISINNRLSIKNFAKICEKIHFY